MPFTFSFFFSRRLTCHYLPMHATTKCQIQYSNTTAFFHKSNKAHCHHVSRFQLSIGHLHYITSQRWLAYHMLRAISWKCNVITLHNVDCPSIVLIVVTFIRIWLVFSITMLTVLLIFQKRAVDMYSTHHYNVIVHPLF